MDHLEKGAASQVFKNIVEAESAGRIEVALFPAGALGGETDLLQNTQDGTLAMSMVSGPFSKVCPEAAVLDIPYVFPNANVAWNVLDGDFGKELAAHCLEKPVCVRWPMVKPVSVTLPTPSAQFPSRKTWKA